MSAGSIFSKTMPFVWAKLMLGLATVLISTVLFAVLMGLAWLFNSESVTVIMFFIWISGTGFVNFILMQYFGYLVKAGHVAVIAEAVTTGFVPPNQVEYGKQCVQDRFATSNVYFAVDKLVSAAVKQIQRGIGKLGNALDFIPGMSTVTGLAQFFIELSLGYIDECCLGYTFYRRDQGAFKSAADGVVIYAQNWKTLLGSAAKTMVMVLLALGGITLALFIVLGILFRLFNWPGWIAFAIALLIALAIKFAFIDSYILVKTMVSYMQVAPATTITFDLYNQLSGISAKFKELWNKGQQEPTPSPAAAQPAYAGAPGTVVTPQTTRPVAQPFQQAPQQMSPQVPPPVAVQVPPQVAQANLGDRPVFCGQCGAKNERGTKFCGSCGAPLP